MKTMKRLNSTLLLLAFLTASGCSGQGGKQQTSQVSGSYTVLFFNNPDCQECEHMKEVLSRLTVPGVRIVAIYPDEDVELWKKAAYPKGWVNGYIGQESGEQQSYDLRAIPCLYLLDKDKKIIQFTPHKGFHFDNLPTDSEFSPNNENKKE